MPDIEGEAATGGDLVHRRDDFAVIVGLFGARMNGHEQLIQAGARQRRQIVPVQVIAVGETIDQGFRQGLADGGDALQDDPVGKGLVVEADADAAIIADSAETGEDLPEVIVADMPVALAPVHRRHRAIRADAVAIGENLHLHLADGLAEGLAGRPAVVDRLELLREKSAHAKASVMARAAGNHRPPENPAENLKLVDGGVMEEFAAQGREDPTHRAAKPKCRAQPRPGHCNGLSIRVTKAVS